MHSSVLCCLLEPDSRVQGGGGGGLVDLFKGNCHKVIFGLPCMGGKENLQLFIFLAEQVFYVFLFFFISPVKFFVIFLTLKGEFGWCGHWRGGGGGGWGGGGGGG